MRPVAWVVLLGQLAATRPISITFGVGDDHFTPLQLTFNRTDNLTAVGAAFAAEHQLNSGAGCDDRACVVRSIVAQLRAATATTTTTATAPPPPRGDGVLGNSGGDTPATDQGGQPCGDDGIGSVDGEDDVTRRLRARVCELERSIAALEQSRSYHRPRGASARDEADSDGGNAREGGCYGDDDDELEALGAILLAQRLSELSLAPELRDTFGVREPEAPRRAFTSRARSIIAVPLGGDEDDVPSRPAATRASDAPPRLDHEPPPGPPDDRHPPLRDAAARAGVAKLERWGAVLFEGALDERRAAEGGRAVLAELAAPTYPFVDINCPKRRHDYPASLAFPGAAASLLEATTDLIAPVLAATLGVGARLVEVGSITAMPGADEQPRHADNNGWALDTARGGGLGTRAPTEPGSRASALVLSVFVSLSAVGDDMGALDLWLGTHTHFSAHANEAAAAWADATPAARIARVPPGSVVVMDSRTQHRGSANTSDRERPVFYCTWMSEHGMPPTGSTYSMRRQYVGTIALPAVLDRSYRAIVAERDRGNAEAAGGRANATAS